MILSDSAILQAMEQGQIVIKPFDRERLGSNSYDVTLAKTVGQYEKLTLWEGVLQERRVLDVKKEETLDLHEMDETGLVLWPGRLYLAATEQYTESHGVVPIFNGKSSLGRLGFSAHHCAGTGDDGFCGYWTLEMTVVHPLRVYPGMPIGQLLWFEMKGECERPYDKKASAKYANASPVPVASRFWKNFR